MLFLAGVFAAVLLCASACEVALTTAEISADRSRAVELFGQLRAFASAFGWSVNGVGDVNGDGLPDFVVAAPYDDIQQTTIGTMGAVYILFGRTPAEWASAQFDFNVTDTPDPASWIRISETTSSVYFSHRGVEHGDFNGDGLSDLLIGSLYSNTLCVFGHLGNWSSFNVSSVGSAEAPGFAIYFQGNSVGNAGDMNGDGIEDMLVGSNSASYVVFGVEGMNRSNLAVPVSGTDGFSLGVGLSVDEGCSAGSAGDVNGDGLNDLAFGLYSYSSNTGRAYVLFARNVSETGQQWSSLNLNSDLDGTNGFIFSGPSSSSYVGRTVLGAGDLNADGFADLFVGSGVPGGTVDKGAWIIFGHPTPWTSPIGASDITGNNGFHFAASTGENWGFAGCGAGDVNGDGVDDIVVGGRYAQNSEGATSGAAVILFGHNGSWPVELSHTDAVGSVGFQIDGPSAGCWFGNVVRGAGDVNGDGLADVIIGGHGLNNQAGYATIVFGVPDDNCAVCSNTTDACIVCDDGFSLNGTFACVCPAGTIVDGDGCLACTGNTYSLGGAAMQCTLCALEGGCTACDHEDGSCTECPAGTIVDGDGCSAESSSIPTLKVVVIINFLDDVVVSDPQDLQEEIANALGIGSDQLNIAVISPTEVEVTVIDISVAQQLISLVELCAKKDQQ